MFLEVMTSSQEPLRFSTFAGVLGVHCFVSYLTLVLALIGTQSMAQEQAVLPSPKSYVIERYEAGWNKNPFTLKTTPAVVPQASFAKDLAIASIYGDRRDPTVSIVNVKTHERFLLKVGRPTDLGIEIKEVCIGVGRKDTVVKIAMGAELSEVHYDTDYLMQLTASAGARAAPAMLHLRQQTVQQQPGQPALHSPATTQQQPLVHSRTPNPRSPEFAPTSSSNLQPAYAAVGGNSGTQSARPPPTSSRGDATTPSLADQMLSLNMLPLRRFTFRTGNETIISHPDPQ